MDNNKPIEQQAITDPPANGAVTQMEQAPPKERFFSTSRMAKMGIFSSLAFVLYTFAKFPLPFIFPSFLKFNFSDIPALLGAFMLGPVAGIIIVCLKIALKLAFDPTDSFYVGELSDLLIGISFVVIASLIYGKHRTKKRAAAAIGISAGVNVIISLLVNAFIIIPMYVELMFKGSTAPIIGACSAVLPFMTINESNYLAVYTFLAALPFNALRCVVCGLITFFSYKRLSYLFRKF